MYIYQNKPDKACLQHYVAHRVFKNLPSRTASDKVLRKKTFNIAKNVKYNGYQRDFASMVYNFFEKRSSAIPARSLDD